MTRSKALKDYFKKFYDIDAEGMTSVDVMQDFLKKKYDYDSEAATHVGVIQEMIDNELSPWEGGGGGTDYLPDLVQNTLTSYYNDEITSMKSNAFIGNTNLVSIELPNCLTCALNAFAGCTSLSTVKLPKLRSFNGNTCFNNCTSLTVVVFPSLETASNTAFQHCSNLTVADLLISAGSIGTSGVFLDSKLNTLIIRASRVASLGNVNCFNETPFASGGTGGTLYVPSAQISGYQAATNWSTILGYTNNQILPIEGSIYETQYADGTPISA